jgi:undecaprenyl-diphosphatase
MVIGRLTAGVHWLTDIIGAILLSAGLYLLYRSCVILTDPKRDVENHSGDL